jgi:ADP-heptose:LPS heptosyltransferase
MGDVAMTVPVLKAYLLQNPQVKLTVVSRPFFAPFFANIPNLSFFAIDLKQRHKGFFGLWRLFLDLRKLDIDAVADLHNVLRSKIIRTFFLLSGKKVAATNKGRKEKKQLTKLTNKKIFPLKDMFSRHVEVFQKLGFSISLENPIFPENFFLEKEILKITGTKKQNWIGIAPFAQYDAKVYPLHLMENVVQLLSQENCKIFLFGGGKKEIELLHNLKKNYENVIVVAGKLGLSDELALISNLEVMLSMDSGNAHIAAMLGKKVVTIWGNTHPFLGFKPFNQPLENCITADRKKYPFIPTSVYGNKHIKGYENVMETISPPDICNKIVSLL